MADGKYNIYSQDEIDERLSALEQKIVRPTVEKQLKIKTLPTLAEDLYAIPVVIPNAVQGTFPAFDGSEPTEKLDDFAEEVVSQFRTLSGSVTTKINDAIQNIEPSESSSPIEIDQATKDSLVANTISQIKAQNVIRDTIIRLLYPVNSTITTYDSAFNPNTDNGTFKLALGSSSKWELVKTEETLSHTFTCVAKNTGGSAPPGVDIQILPLASLVDFNEQLESIWGSTEKPVSGGGTKKDYWLHSNGSNADFTWTIVKKDWNTIWETYGSFFAGDGSLYARGLDLTGNNGTNISFYVTVFKNRPCYTWKRVA